MSFTTTGQKAIVRHAIIKGQPWSESIVDVVEIDGDRLRYTTDGIWFSDTTRSEYGDWELIETTPTKLRGPYHTKVKSGGMWTAPRYFDTLAEALDAVHATTLPAIAALGSDIITVNLAAYNIGIRAVNVCPLHGPECEAWA